MRYASEEHSLQRIFPITAPLHWKLCQGQYICCYCYCYCFTLTQISCSMVEVRKCQQKSKWQDARKHPGKQKILIFLQVEMWLTFTVIFNSYNNNNIGTWSESPLPTDLDVIRWRHCHLVDDGQASKFHPEKFVTFIFFHRRFPGIRHCSSNSTYE